MFVLLDLELKISFYVPYHTYIPLYISFCACQKLNLWLAILTQGGKKKTNTDAEVNETCDPAIGIQALYEIQLRRRWNG